MVAVPKSEEVHIRCTSGANQLWTRCACVKFEVADPTSAKGRSSRRRRTMRVNQTAEQCGDVAVSEDPAFLFPGVVSVSEDQAQRGPVGKITANRTARLGSNPGDLEAALALTSI